MAVATPMTMMPRAKADQYDDQINALQKQIDQYQSSASSLATQADTLQNELARLTNEKAQIQSQIDLSQAQYNSLQNQINDTQKKITDNKNALGTTIADMYVDNSISPLEMLASSKNIGDYVDKQSYRASVNDQLKQTINTINDLKNKLEKDQQSVKIVLANQTSSKEALIVKETEQANLLATTQGQEAAYQQLSDKAKSAQIAAHAAQQAEIASRIASSGGATLVSGGAAPDYPWNSSNCAMVGYLSTGGVDGNGTDGHGYGCRQCASFAAWKVARETDTYPNNWGNAQNFPSSARGVFATGYTPRANSLAVMSGSSAGNGEGHIVWVDAVNGDGTLTVEQYNYNYGAGYGMYSKMKLSASIFDLGYIYIK